ncbi:hypothetical protein D9M73_93320 [compost metagenome]
MLVRHERALHRKVEQNHADDQPRDRQPRPENQPGQQRQHRPQHDHAVRPVAVGETPRHRCRENADRADNAEQPGDIRPQREARRLQIQGQDRPERGEGRKQQSLRRGGQPQFGEFAPQAGQRRHQRRITNRRLGQAARQPRRHQPARAQRQRHAQPEHCAPSGMRRHQPGERPAEQDAAQQPSHHRADRRAALGRIGQMRRERHDLLRDRRRHPDQQRRHQQQGDIGGHRRQCQRQRQHHELHDDQPLALQQIAQRREQEQPRRIAQLRRGRHQPGPRAGQIPLDNAEHRLVIIDVGYGNAGRDRHRQREPVRQRARFGAVRLRCPIHRFVLLRGPPSKLTIDHENSEPCPDPDSPFGIGDRRLRYANAAAIQSGTRASPSASTRRSSTISPSSGYVARVRSPASPSGATTSRRLTLLRWCIRAVFSCPT